MATVYSSRESLSGAPTAPDRVALVDGNGIEGLYVYKSGDFAGEFSRNTIEFASKGANGDTITIDGSKIVLKDSATDLGEVQIGDLAQDTAEAFVAHVNVDEPDRFNVTAARDAINSPTIVKLTAKTRGLSGNLIALSTVAAPTMPPHPPPVRLGSPLLTGGTFAPNVDEVYSVAPNPEVDERTHIPPSGTTGSAGVWIPQLEHIKPTFFGNYNQANPANHRRMIQLAMEASARHGFIVDIDRRWEVRKQVRVPSGAIVEGTSSESAIVSVNVEDDVYRSAVLFGGWSPVYGANRTSANAQNQTLYQQYVEWIDCLPAEPGGVIALANADDLLKIPFGVAIFIRERDWFYNKAQMPLYIAANLRIRRPSGGAGIALQFPITRRIDHPQIAIADFPVSLIDGSGQTAAGLKQGKTVPDFSGQRGRAEGGPLYVVRGIRFYGVGLQSAGGLVGTTVISAGNATHGQATLLDCDLDIPWVKGRTGVFLSRLCYSRIRVGRIDAWEKVLEVAAGGAASSISIGSGYSWKHTEGNSGAAVQVGENAVDTRIEIDELSVEDQLRFVDEETNIEKDADYVAVVRAARGIRLKIGRLCAPAWKRALVGVVNTLRPKDQDQHEVQSHTEEIDIEIVHAEGGDQLERYVELRNLGMTMKNVTIRGTFLGPVSGGAALLAGSDVTFDAYVENGAIDVAETTGVWVDMRGSAAGVVGLSSATAPRRLGRAEGVYAPPNIAGSGGASGTASYAPDLRRGWISDSERVHSVGFTGAGTFTVAAPANGRIGTIFTLKIRNGNMSTAAALQFDAAYRNVAAARLPAGNCSSVFTFAATSASQYFLLHMDENLPA